MENKQVKSLMANTSKLIKLQQEAQKTMRQLVMALAKRHLEENKVEQAIFDWEDTVSALDLAFFGKPYFGSKRVMSVSSKPTHLRLHDLKPVRIQFHRTDSGETSYISVHAVRGKTLEHITEDELERDYLELSPLADAEDK